MSLRAAVVAAALLAVAAAAASHTVLHFSDFHYDPYFGQPRAVGPCRSAAASTFGEPGCDSSLQIIDSVLADAKQVATAQGDGAALFLYTGDWMRHEMASFGAGASALGEQIVRTLARKISARHFGAARAPVAGHHVVAHPSVPVALGNEDFIPDYHFDVSTAGNNTLLLKLAAIFAHEGLMSAAQAKEFGYCGFTSSNVRHGGASADVVVLSLNTLIWARDVKPAARGDDPCGQFAWLDGRLRAAAAAGQRVYIASHIPPGIVFWHDRFYGRYRALMQRYSGAVAAQFYGHIHRFAFMVEDGSAADAVSPVFIGGPITRVSKTNPDYGVVAVDGNWTVTEYTQRYLTPGDTWLDGTKLKYNFALPDLSSASLLAFDRRMEKSPELYGQFSLMLNGGAFSGARCSNGTKDASVCRLGITCFMVSLNVSQGLRCAEHLAALPFR
jgi:hypothetical protein